MMIMILCPRLIDRTIDALSVCKDGLSGCQTKWARYTLASSVFGALFFMVRRSIAYFSFSRTEFCWGPDRRSSATDRTREDGQNDFVRDGL
jgi:hypothetical protein